MHIYGGKKSRYELSPTFSSISKGSYFKALIFLPSPYNLSLFNCSHNLSPTLNDFSIICCSCLALYLCCVFCSVSCTCKWISIIFSINFSALKASPIRSSLTSPCCPYAISKGEGGKYPKQVSNEEFHMDV